MLTVRVNREVFICMMGGLNIEIEEAAASDNEELFKILVNEKNQYFKEWPIGELMECVTSSKKINLTRHRMERIKGMIT